MAIVGIGVDVCEVERWRAMCRRRPGVAARVLTTGELELSPVSQAGRWAAKEALAKALGAPTGLAWHDCEVQRTSSGAPRFVLQGTVAQRAAELGIATIHLSISHDGGLATAFVVCEA